MGKANVHRPEYIQFPLIMVRKLFINHKEAIKKIMTYGFYNFSKFISYTIDNVARQIIYSYGCKRSDLSNDLIDAIEGYIKEGKLNIDVKNYDSGITELKEIFTTDTSFKTNAIEFYQMHQSFDLFHVPGNIPETLRRGKETDKHIPEKEPFPMINIKLLFKFRDYDKSEFEIAQLAAYIAVRSILGKKPYCRTNKLMIISRMFGYTNHFKLFEDNLNEKPELYKLYQKYSTRYHIDKVLQELELNWNVIYYSKKIKGMYVGMKDEMKNISYDSLAVMAEAKKRKNQIQKLKDQKIEARQKAIQQINLAAIQQKQQQQYDSLNKVFN
jgi:hypothetical protein